MRDNYCTVCLSADKRNINIFKSVLQHVYENLANIKVKSNGCWVCFICHARLQQCLRLQQLAVKTRGLVDDICDNEIDVNFGMFKSLMELSSITNILFTIQPTLNIESALDTQMEHIDTGAELMIKKEKFDEMDSQSSSFLECREIKKESEEWNGVKDDEGAYIEIKCEYYGDEVASSKSGPDTDDDSHEQLLNDDGNNTWRLTTEMVLIEKQSPIVTNMNTQPSHIEDTIIIVKKEIPEDLGNAGIGEGNEHESSSDSERPSYAGEPAPDCELDTNSGARSGLSPTDSASNRGLPQGDKPHSCQVCLKKFSQTCSLQRHMKVHTGKEPFSCSVCLKKFTQIGHLQQHARTHTGVKPYTCDVCLKTFSHTGNLQRHMKLHTGDKPYSCNVCSRRFTQVGHLQQHIRVHTGDKPYSCDICYKKFSHTGNLQLHTKTHRGEKPYTCDVCLKKFSQKVSLQKHMGSHMGDKPYRCDVCLKQYSNEISLQRHMKYHLEDKPFSCDVCLKKFARIGILQSHIKVHTGDKPYGCEVCLKKFTQKVNLHTHMRIHTGDKP